MSTTYISESYRQQHPGEEPSYAEASLVGLEQRITRVAAKLPESESAALLQVASASQNELAAAGSALDTLLGQRDIFHTFRRGVEYGLDNAQSHPHAALIFSSGPNTIRPVAPVMSPRQFTQLAQDSLRAHGIYTSMDSGVMDRAYTQGKQHALTEVRRQAEQVLEGLEANLGNPQLVAQARRQILDRLTEAYVTRIEKKLGQIEKHIGKISKIGRLALGKQRRTNSELADIGILTREIAGITLLGDRNFELDFNRGGRNWLEVTGLISTDRDAAQRLKAVANAYPGLLQNNLQRTIDTWVAQAKGAKSGGGDEVPKGPQGKDPAADVALLRSQGLGDKEIYRRLTRFIDPEDKNGYLQQINLILRNKARTPVQRGGRDARYQER